MSDFQFNVFNVDLEGPSAVAKVLIEKVSSAIAGATQASRYYKLERVKADAKIIHAKADIAVEELRERALNRFVDEQVKQQMNMEGVAAKALPEIKIGAVAENVEDDWVTEFFQKCRTVSNQDAQSLWAKVLAGEFNAPGSFSKRTLNVLSMISHFEALTFQQLCKTVWNFGGTLYPVLSPMPFESLGLSHLLLEHLEAAELIKFHDSNQHITIPKSTHGGKMQIAVAYFQSLYTLLPSSEGSDLNMGRVMFTPAGAQLSRIADVEGDQKIEKSIVDAWNSKKEIIKFGCKLDKAI